MPSIRFYRLVLIPSAIGIFLLCISFFVSSQTPLTAQEKKVSLKPVDTFDWQHLAELTLDQRGFPALPDDKFFYALQPDGTIFQVRRQGVESYNWLETTDGRIIGKNLDTGYFEYLLLDKQMRYRLSGVLVGISDHDVNNIPHFVRESKAVVEEKVKRYLAMLDSERKAFAREKMQVETLVDTEKTPVYTPATGVVRQLVILVTHPTRETTYTQADFDRYFNEEGYAGHGAHGSFRDYYLDISYGALDVRSTVTDWVTLPNDISYYGRKNPTREDPVRYSEFCIDSIEALDATGFDFSEFDSNGDGYIDSLAIIRWGEGQENATGTFFLWSRMDTLDPHYSVDGVSIACWYTTPELRQSGMGIGPGPMANIGGACHEFGHMISLEDTYDPVVAYGVGRWCLMSAGDKLDNGKRPCQPLMYHKIKLGWVTPDIVVSSRDRAELRRSDAYQDVFKIARRMRFDEYLLLENRQKTGWDTALPGHGLIVTHIDDRIRQNIDPDRYKVAVLQADGERDLENSVNRGDDSDPFPGSEEMVHLTPFTTPSTDANSGRNTGIWITNIAEAGRKIVCDIGIASEPDNPYWPGPDDFGYFGHKTTGGFTDIGSTGIPVSFSDEQEGVASVTFPSKFRFYFYRNKRKGLGPDFPLGTNRVKISINGWMTFNTSIGPTAIGSHPSNHSIPSSLAPGYLMAPLWKNLRIDRPGCYVKYRLIGTKPDRIFIVQWSAKNQMTLRGKNLKAKFQVKLFENGKIEFCYDSVGTHDNSATIGIQKDGIVGLRYSHRHEQDLRGGDRLIFSRNNYPPFGMLVVPGAGSGGGTTFEATFLDPDGARDLTECHFLVGRTDNPVNGVHIIYNQATNQIGMRRDVGTGFDWARLGSAGTLTGDRADLNVSGTNKTRSGDQLTLTLPITFKSRAFSGLKNIYLKAIDRMDHESEWSSVWTYHIRANNPPVAVQVMPNDGKGYDATFIAEYLDRDGWRDLKALYFLINDHVSEADSVYLKYIVASNELKLRNIAGDGWISGNVGDTGTVANPNAEINLFTARAVGDGMRFHLTLPIHFENRFSGAKQIFMKVEDNSGAVDDWHPVGNWNIY